MPNKYKDIIELKRKSLKRRMTKVQSYKPENKRLKTNTRTIEPISLDLETSKNQQVPTQTTSALTMEEEIISYDQIFSVEMPSDKNESSNHQTLTADNLSTFLKQWTIRNNVSHKCLNEQLSYFKQFFPTLPKDSRTLLGTPISSNIIDMAPGKYLHIGVKKGLEEYLSSLHDIPDSISIDFNIDGVPISRSTTSSFWTIQGKCVLSKKIFVVGVYHGYHKPDNFNDFLRPFVSEMKELMKDYAYQGNSVKIKIGVIICDTPAKAAILGIKNHGGYSSCPACFVVGDYINNRMTLQETDARKRTDESFRQREDHDHHKNITILAELDIDLVAQFPLDYLHIVLLGVMKKFLKMLTLGTIESLLHSRNINAINKRIKNITSSIPKEFQKHYLPSISKLHEYKASHFRSFLLYVGPFVMQDIIGKEQYNHFMCLHVAIYLLCHEKLPNNIINFCKNLLDKYVNDFKIVYGKHHIVYVVHALCHIADDVLRHGNLEKFSSFPYESFNYKIKNMLRKHELPLAQINRRLEELSNLERGKIEVINYPELKEKSIVTIDNLKRVIYKKIIFEHFEITNNQRNMWFFTKTKNIVKFMHAVKKHDGIYLFGSEVTDKTNFFTEPIFSSNINIFKTGLKDETPKYWKADSILTKLFCMEKSSELVNWIVEENEDEDEDEELIIPSYRVFYPLIHSNKIF